MSNLKSDPKVGGDISDMAVSGTKIPTDAGAQRLIPSVPNPAQEEVSKPGALPADGTSSLADSATNPADMPRQFGDAGMTGDVVSGTGNPLPASVESKRAHNLGHGDPSSGAAKGHPREAKHGKQSASDLDRYQGSDASVDRAPNEELKDLDYGERQLDQGEARENRPGM